MSRKSVKYKPGDKCLAGCRAYPRHKEPQCPAEWCKLAQYAEMCGGCPHFKGGAVSEWGKKK